MLLHIDKGFFFEQTWMQKRVEMYKIQLSLGDLNLFQPFK